MDSGISIGKNSPHPMSQATLLLPFMSATHDPTNANKGARTIIVIPATINSNVSVSIISPPLFSYSLKSLAILANTYFFTAITMARTTTLSLKGRCCGIH
jgi:hypothetical protein